MKHATRIRTTALPSFPHFARIGASPFRATWLPSCRCKSALRHTGGKAEHRSRFPAGRRRGGAGAARPGADKGAVAPPPPPGEQRERGEEAMGAAMGGRVMGLLVSEGPGPQLSPFGVYWGVEIFLLGEPGVLPRAVFRVRFQQFIWDLAFTSCLLRVRGSSQSAPKPGEANGAGVRTGSRLCSPSGEGLGEPASPKSSAVPLAKRVVL